MSTLLNSEKLGSGPNKRRCSDPSTQRCKLQGKYRFVRHYVSWMIMKNAPRIHPLTSGKLMVDACADTHA